MRLLCRITALLSLSAILWATASVSQAARIRRAIRVVRPVAPVGAMYVPSSLLVSPTLPAQPGVVAGTTWVAPTGTWITGPVWAGVRRVTRRGVITVVPNNPARRRVLRIR